MSTHSASQQSRRASQEEVQVAPLFPAGLACRVEGGLREGEERICVSVLRCTSTSTSVWAFTTPRAPWVQLSGADQATCTPAPSAHWGLYHSPLTTRTGRRRLRLEGLPCSVVLELYPVSGAIAGCTPPGDWPHAPALSLAHALVRRGRATLL